MQTTNPSLSMICTLLGMLSLGITDNLMPLISDTSSLWLFHAVRSTVIVPAIIVLSLLGLGTLRAKRPGWVLLRNFFNGTALLIYFGCLAFLPIGVVVAGFFTAPIFVLLFSVAFRGERIGLWRWAAVVVGFAGSLMVVWPEDGGLSVLSVLPIVAGMFYAVSAIGTRTWCEGESALVMTLAFFAVLGLFGVIGLSVLTIWPVDAPSGADGWVLRGYVVPDATLAFVVCAQAVGSIAGVMLLTRGYQLGEASYVAINEYSFIVFASVFAWVFWGQVLGALAISGIVLIIASGTIIALRSNTRPA